MEILFPFIAITFININISSAHNTETVPLSKLQTYIVQVNNLEAGVSMNSEDLDSWYNSFLPVTPSSSNHRQPPRLVYSYRNAVPGFAARLTAEEAEPMENKNGLTMSFRPEKTSTLQTTHSPKFLGLQPEMGLWKESNYGKGVITGVLDSGIFPGHPSVSDEGLPPTPAKWWKGKCEFNGTLCNNKIIGARNFQSSDTKATGPLDEVGHGTHTASTAAGGFVNANLLGNAYGTAVGIAPYAHLTIYQVCNENYCAESYVLAGIDGAIDDGVYVISISLATGGLFSFVDDPIALGSFSAMQKGIFVSCSAGNSGPSNMSVANGAPWVLTVGASTTNRIITTTVQLANRAEFDGQSVYQPKGSKSTWFRPLVYPGADGKTWSPICINGSLDNIDVRGKIVLCERSSEIKRSEQGKVVKNAGAFAMILMNTAIDGFSTLAELYVLPTIHVSFSAGINIKHYINTTSNPKVKFIFNGTVLSKNPSAPMVASFSGRGPNSSSPRILKPDIIGPGLSILAAWPFSLDKDSNSKSPFNMMSGQGQNQDYHYGGAEILICFVLLLHFEK